MQGSHSLLFSSVCSYQVVSEHSILGALEATRQKTMESRPENSALGEPEGKLRLEEIEKHWKRRRKPEEKKCRTRRHHAPTRRSGRRDKILKKMEEILVDLRSSISDLRKKSGVKETGETGKETRLEERSEQATMKEQREGGSPEETTPAESSPEALPENDAATVEMRTVCDGEIILSPWNERYDESSRNSTADDSSSEELSEDSSPVAPCVGGTAMEVWFDGNGEERSLSFVGNACDVFGKEKDVCVGWSSRTLDLKFDSLGQAQNLILTPHQLLVSTLDPFNIERSLLKEKTEKKNKLFGFSWSQKKVGLNFNPMGQAHNFIITPPIFTNSGGGFKGKRSAATKVDLFSNMIEMFSHANQEHLPTTKQHVSMYTNTAHGAVTTLTPLIDDSSLSLQYLEAMNMEIVLFDKYVECAEKRKATMPLTKVSRMMESPLARKWDPGGNYHFQLMCLSKLPCLELWDPGRTIFLLLEDPFAIQQEKVGRATQVEEDMKVLIQWKQHPTYDNPQELQTEEVKAFLSSHLEDKVNFKGEGVDEDIVDEGQKGKGIGRLNLGGCSNLCIAWFSCLKPWDPGGNCYTFYITWSLCFQLWDPGGRPLSLEFF